ncbi:MAG TPA: ATP-binding protein [Chloroflexota bacterium]|nr:ATP-binding protein [Chloroflexota bacterium]
MIRVGRRLPRLRPPSALRARLTLWCLAICAAALALFGFLLASEQQTILVSNLDAQLTGLAGKALIGQPAGVSIEYTTRVRSATSYKHAAGSVSIMGDVESSGRIALGDDAATLRRLLAPPKAAPGTGVRASSGQSPVSVLTMGAKALQVPDAPNTALLGPPPVGLDAPACTGLAGWRLCQVAARGGSGRIIAVANMAESLSALQPSIDSLRRWLLIVLPLVLVLATVGCWVLSGRALAPIDRITREARRIGATDLSRRLGLAPRDDEVGRLAATLDAMLARLEAAFAQQRAFTAAASHELRTPLTIVRGDLDVLLERPRRPAEYQEALHEMRGEVERLSDLVADLLTLARADAGAEEMPRDLVALDAVVTAVCADVQRLAHREGVTLELACAFDVVVMGEGRRLHHLLLNLLDNAIRYTPPGGTVRVTLETHGASAYLRVADTGIGIAPDDLPHIFDRFYRADTARSRASGGAGLGLAIARWCVEAHAGQIAVESTPGLGSVFTVLLPLALTYDVDEPEPGVICAASNTIPP